MRMRLRIEGAVEYFLAFLFMWGGFNALGAEVPSLTGPLALLVGQYVIYFYAAFFFFTGALLLYAKLRKKKYAHKSALVLMYLTCVYVTILSIAIDGITFGLLPNILVGVAAAYLWIRWKFRTEYFDPNEIRRIGI